MIELGISINAFVKQALNKVLQEPQPVSFTAEPGMLMEPEATYGSGKKTLRLQIPAKDMAFAQELARRMGWKEA